LHTLIPHTCSALNFEKVKHLVKELELDDRQLESQQFLTLSKNDQVFAFGRLRTYNGFSELCTLGVVDVARHFGLGTKLVNALINSCEHTIYLVCIIPDYFEKLGFQICTDYPAELADKLNYCVSALPVPEPYVVMRLKQNTDR
jgi:N-acetylglutamate synthase-like GNAT family acetyltransferase